MFLYLFYSHWETTHSDYFLCAAHGVQEAAHTFIIDKYMLIRWSVITLICDRPWGLLSVGRAWNTSTGRDRESPQTTPRIFLIKWQYMSKGTNLMTDYWNYSKHLSVFWGLMEKHDMFLGSIKGFQRSSHFLTLALNLFHLNKSHYISKRQLHLKELILLGRSQWPNGSALYMANPK